MQNKETLKWIYNNSKSQIISMIILIIGNGLFAGSSILFAMSTKGVIDGATSRDSAKLISNGLFVLFIIFLQLLLRLICNNLSERVSAKLDISFKSNLYKNILRKDYAKITSYHSGDILNRLYSDVQTVNDGVTSILPSFIGMITKLISAFTILIYLDRNFTLVLIIGGSSLFLVTKAFRGRMKSLHKKVQETEGNVHSFMQESLASLLVIKAFVSEKKINDKIRYLQGENYKARMKKRTINIAANAGFSFIFQMVYLYGLIWSCYGLYNQTITFGTLTAILQLVAQIQSPFANLSGLLPKYYNAIASAERLIEIEQIKDEDEINSGSLDILSTYNCLNSIEFKNISFGYDRDLILEETSLIINKGDFIAITGISGIGKSTLLKLLLGVFSDYTGDIYLQTDNDKIKIDKHSRTMFSYVPQGNLLFSGTIKENLTFINENVTDEEIQEAIKISCADSFINGFPDGLNTIIGEKGMGLSEGQMQRIAIARAILTKSKIILLDEATSALDESTEETFLKNMKNMSEVTCIIISHKKAAITICNRSIYIENKKIIEHHNSL